MTMQVGEKAWKIPNKMKPAFAKIYKIMEWIDDLAIPEQEKYFIYSALEELLSNKIRYGFEDSVRHDIAVRIAADGEAVRIELEDDGPEFDPTLQPAPDIDRNMSDGVVGGLGIELVRRICSEMTYRREDGFNRIALRVDILEPTAAE